MSEIRYSSDFNKDYLKLLKRASEGNSEANYIISLIVKATAKLSENAEAGIKLPQRLWPKEYARKFDISNLWKFNLDSNWRLIYTISYDGIKIFLVYLECLSHKEYDRKFGYKTS